jgi:peptidoglycan/xylan/chitin deacetylase (PgdA/CDA1 family)
MRTKRVYFHGSRERGEIALTFDDGPSKETKKVLDILKKEKVVATFFVLGNKIDKNKNLLKRMIRQRCEIANHSFDHKNLMFKRMHTIEKSILDTDAKLKSIGVKTRLVRPPHLLFGPALLFLSKKLNKKIILWDVHSEDWRSISADKVIRKVLRGTKNGSIIGFHDYKEGIGSNEKIIPILKAVIPALKSRGYKFATVSELLRIS